MLEIPPPVPSKSLVNGFGPKGRSESAISNNDSEEPLSLKRKVIPMEQPSPVPLARDERDEALLEKKPKNGLTEIKNEHMARSAYAAYAVPIFACHTQGFYIPLNVDYDTLLPYLNGIDLFGKNYLQMPPLHPISISVNYAPASLVKAAVNGRTSTSKPKLVEGMVNGC